MKRKICVFTSTRAEYGLLRWIMNDIQLSDDLDLQLLVSGTHLSPEFGMTVEEIEDDGFDVDHRVEMLLDSDTPSAVTKSMGLAMVGFADVFRDLEPDIVVILGDRLEALVAAMAATVAQIPIAHLHGGEVTEGAIDEAFRHSITKMAHIHFVAAEPYRNRVLQLGEEVNRVFVVGGLGLDNLERLELMDRSELADSLGFDFGERNLLITFHPVTIEPLESSVQFGELLAVLERLDDTGLIFTLPNADVGSRALAAMVEDFTNERANAAAFNSLGQARYLACLREVDGIVGNSSSGLLEAPSLGTGTVDIGSRQQGRLRAPSVISCHPDRDQIAAAITRLHSKEFRAVVKKRESPYGRAGASAKVVQTLSTIALDSILKKHFVDHPVRTQS